MQVWAFLSILEFQPTPANQQGTSWIEFLALFELYGGSVDDLGMQIQHPATTRSTVRASLIKFKKVVRNVVLLCVGASDQLFFKPSKLPEPRLKSIGYGNFMSCLMFPLNGII